MCRFSINVGIFIILPFLIPIAIYIVLHRKRKINILNTRIDHLINNFTDLIPNTHKVAIGFLFGLLLALSTELINRPTKIYLLIIILTSLLFFLLKKSTLALALSISILLLSMAINIQYIDNLKHDLILKWCQKDKFKVLYCPYPLDKPEYKHKTNLNSINEYLDNIKYLTNKKYGKRVYSNSMDIDYSVCRVKSKELNNKYKNKYNLLIFGEADENYAAISMLIPAETQQEYFGPAFKTAVFSVNNEKKSIVTKDNTMYYYDRFLCTTFQYSLNEFEKSIKGQNEPPEIIQMNDCNSIRICIDRASYFRIYGIPDSVKYYLDLSYTIGIRCEVYLPWDYYYENAWLYFYNRDFTKAEEYFLEAVNVYSDSYGMSLIYYDLVYYCGINYLHKDDIYGYRHAIEQFSFCMDSYKDNYEFLNNYGHALIKNQQYDRAINILTKAETLNQDCYVVKSNLYRGEILKCITSENNYNIPHIRILEYEMIGQERPEIYYYMARLFENDDYTHLNTNYTRDNYLNMLCEFSNHFKKLDRNILPSDAEEMMNKCEICGIICY